MLTAALAGALAGVLAQKGIARTVQLAAPDATTRLPPALPSVDAGRLWLLVAAMVVGLLALSVVAAAQVVRGARGSTLRESG